MTDKQDLRIFVLNEVRERSAARRRSRTPDVDQDPAASQALWLRCADAALHSTPQSKSAKSAKSPGPKFKGHKKPVKKAA